MSPWKWWFAIAGTAIIAGGVAWLFKLGAIVATDGRVVATGAAATFLELGLGLLMVGSTGVGVRLAMNQEPSMRVVLALASPLVFGGVVYIVGGAIGYAILIIGGAIVGVGMWLVAGVTLWGVARGTRGTSGNREAESQPRVR